MDCSIITRDDGIWRNFISERGRPLNDVYTRNGCAPLYIYPHLVVIFTSTYNVLSSVYTLYTALPQFWPKNSCHILCGNPRICLVFMLYVSKLQLLYRSSARVHVVFIALTWQYPFNTFFYSDFGSSFCNNRLGSHCCNSDFGQSLWLTYRCSFFQSPCCPGDVTALHVT